MISKLTLGSTAALAFVISLGGRTADAQWDRIDKAAVAAPASEANPAPETYGTLSETVVPYFSGDFQLLQGVEGPWDGNTGGRLCAQGGCLWVAGMALPNGAEIRSIEVSACDGDAVGLVSFALPFAPKVPSGHGFLVPYTGTGGPQTPGCNSFVVNLATPHTVDNNAYGYALVVYADPGTNVEWTQFRVRYRLQVSPAPATATFMDVPVGSAQHRFVEALAAAGITGGCGAGLYCPDAPVTRGQMAVFLAVALGLHFPN